MLHLDSRCSYYCDVKKGRGGSSGRRAGSIEHEDVNLADTFSRFAEKWRCTIGGQEIATDTDRVRGCHFLGALARAAGHHDSRAVLKQCPGGRQAESMH